MPIRDLSVGMTAGPLSGNPHIGTSSKAFGGNPHIAKATGGSPVKDWIYKGDTKGRDHYKNMNFKTALAAENPLSKSYEGFKTGYTGPDKTSLGGYFKQGIDSLFGKSVADSNISGGTTGSRYAYERAAKAAAAFTPIGRLANVGNLSFQGTNAVIDQFGLRDNFKNIGKSIYDFTHRG